MLSLKQIKDYCLVDSMTHTCCRYLIQDDIDAKVYYCLKASGKSKQIDEEIDLYLEKMKKMGKDPLQDNLPLGDNCKGYPFMRYIEQGYDKDN